MERWLFNWAISLQHWDGRSFTASKNRVEPRQANVSNVAQPAIGRTLLALQGPSPIEGALSYAGSDALSKLTKGDVMPKEHHNPPDLFPSRQYGFSQIVTAQGGKLVFMSGQVAWDGGQVLVGRGVSHRSFCVRQSAGTIHAIFYKFRASWKPSSSPASRKRAGEVWAVGSWKTENVKMK